MVVAVAAAPSICASDGAPAAATAAAGEPAAAMAAAGEPAAATATAGEPGAAAALAVALAIMKLFILACAREKERGSGRK